MSAITDNDAAVFDATVIVTAEIGFISLEISQVLKVGRGAVIELNKMMDQPIYIKIDDYIFPSGTLESSGDIFTIRVGEIFS